MSKKQGITRRDAVIAASAVGVAASVAKKVKAEAPAFLKSVHAANNQLNYGIIGTGGRGQYLLGLLKSVDNGKCVAICDVDDASLQKGLLAIGSGPKTYKDYRQLLADSSVESVIIATPVYLHYTMLEDALKAGKHVFCEKSLVFTEDEVHRLRSIYPSQHPKQVLQVGLQRRYSEYYNAVKQMVDKGMLGEVKYIYGQWHRNPGWTMKPNNWRLYRKTSGGLAAELGSHHFDVADWMFGSQPEMVMGLGGLDTMKDGRDIYDNIQLIFKYPKGKKMIWSGSSTTSHLPLFNGARAEQGEMICGTGGTVHITIGDGKMDPNPPVAIWYKEPTPPPTVTQGAKPEKFQAGASFNLASGGKALPILLTGDQRTGNESFVEKELKFARQWLYAKGIMVPNEARNPVTVSLESFFNDCKKGATPRANYEIGLDDSISVILANRAMDEERRVLYSELGHTSKPGAVPGAPPAAKKKTANT
jgi:predicted dehydrogenase